MSYPGRAARRRGRTCAAAAGRSGKVRPGQSRLPPPDRSPAPRRPRSLSPSSARPARDAAERLPKSTLHHPLTLLFLFTPVFSRLLISLASAFPSSSPRPSSPGRPLGPSRSPQNSPAPCRAVGRTLAGKGRETRGGRTWGGHRGSEREKVVTSAGPSPRWRGGTPERQLRPRAGSPGPLSRPVPAPAPGRDWEKEGGGLLGIRWNNSGMAQSDIPSSRSLSISKCQP